MLLLNVVHISATPCLMQMQVLPYFRYNFVKTHINKRVSGCLVQETLLCPHFMR
jgi:hypothetical protein